ncbi:proline permease [Cadophora sp. DSE1049]|nr:proline permease [Cadophora sp. DSE1049]
MDPEKTTKAPSTRSVSDDNSPVYNEVHVDPVFGQTKRGLSGRHVQLMALGGSIGTGLFVGIGGSLRSSGPLSLVLGYIAYCIAFIWPCNLCVGEMATYLPIRGSIFEFAKRYVDEAFGFALGWTYFYTAAMLLCAELSAVATVISFWDDKTNPAAWVALALVVMIAANVFAVQWYGESEFIMASTKILLIVGLILLTFITMVGGNPKHDAYGFRHWKNGDFIHAYWTTGSLGEFLGWWKVVLYAAFSVAGPDLLALAAGEIANPRRQIPRVAKRAFYRIAGFYVMGVFAVGILCSSRDQRLLDALAEGSSGAAASPWVIGIQNLGIEGLPSLINFLILLSAWSCGNAYLYAASRTLYSLALDGQAPQIFKKCSKAGVPLYTVAVPSLIGCLAFMVASSSSVTVFGWFVNLATIGFVLSYTGYLVTFIGWYRALKAQGISRDTLPWKAPFQPYTAYFAIGSGCVVVLFSGWNTLKPFDTQGFITSYFGVAFASFMFVLWKVVKRTSFVVPAEADLLSGKAEVDEECRHWDEEPEKERAEMTRMQRFWDACW